MHACSLTPHEVAASLHGPISAWPGAAAARCCAALKGLLLAVPELLAALASELLSQLASFQSLLRPCPTLHLNFPRIAVVPARQEFQAGRWEEVEQYRCLQSWLFP